MNNIKKAFHILTIFVFVFSIDHVSLFSQLNNNEEDSIWIKQDKLDNDLAKACKQSRVNLEKIKFLISQGASIYKEDEYGVMPLKSLVRNKSINIDIVKFLIEECGVDVNRQNEFGVMDLHLIFVNESVDIDIVKYLVERCCADINKANEYGFTPLHNLFKNKSINFEIVSYLIESGANITRGNDSGSTPIDYLVKKRSKGLSKKSVNRISKQIGSLSNGFKALLESGLFLDDEVNGVSFHSLILKARLDVQDLSKTKKVLEYFKKSELEAFFKWVYGHRLSQGELEKIKPIFEKLKVKSPINYVAGLKQMLSRLYNDEKSKDFSIIVGNKLVKVHKLILIALSGLFRGMFLSIEDPNISEVKDYSKRSYNSIQAFIKFLYTNKLFKKDMTENVIEELEDAAEYYQLDENSNFNQEFERVKKLLDEKN